MLLRKWVKLLDYNALPLSVVHKQENATYASVENYKLDDRIFCVSF